MNVLYQWTKLHFRDAMLMGLGFGRLAGAGNWYLYQRTAWQCYGNWLEFCKSVSVFQIFCLYVSELNKYFSLKHYVVFFFFTSGTMENMSLDIFSNTVKVCLTFSGWAKCQHEFYSNSLLKHKNKTFVIKSINVTFVISHL